MGLAAAICIRGPSTAPFHLICTNLGRVNRTRWLAGSRKRLLGQAVPKVRQRPRGHREGSFRSTSKWSALTCTRVTMFVQSVLLLGSLCLLAFKPASSKELVVGQAEQVTGPGWTLGVNYGAVNAAVGDSLVSLHGATRRPGASRAQEPPHPSIIARNASSRNEIF